MLVKKKPFPGDQPDQKLTFAKMGVKKKDVANATKPSDKKENKKKGKKSGFWAKKAAMSLAKKG